MPDDPYRRCYRCSRIDWPNYILWLMHGVWIGMLLTKWAFDL